MNDYQYKKPECKSKKYMEYVKGNLDQLDLSYFQLKKDGGLKIAPLKQGWKTKENRTWKHRIRPS